MSEEVIEHPEVVKSRRRGCLTNCGCVVLALLLVPLLYYGLYLAVKGPRLAQPQVIAHRGDSAHAPENTLAAFRLAAQAGAGWLEMDVQRTQDGRLVVFHDVTLDRLAGRPEGIGDLTFEELQALDMGDGERIPAFEDVVRLAKEAGVGVFPEAKSPELHPGLEEDIVESLRAENSLQQAILQSFEHQGLDAVAAANPELITCPLYGLWKFSLGDAGNSKTVCPMAEMVLLNPWMVRRAHQEGRLVYPWFGATENPLVMRLLLGLGVDGLIVNDPGMLERIVNP
jgi:glycerophosphoryl diester phosphodiesterase